MEKLFRTGLYGEVAYTLVSFVMQTKSLGNLVFSIDTDRFHNNAFLTQGKVLYNFDNEVVIEPFATSDEELRNTLRYRLEKDRKVLRSKYSMRERLYFVPCAVHTAAKSGKVILNEIKDPGWPFGDGLQWFYLKKIPDSITLRDVNQLLDELDSQDVQKMEHDPFLIEARKYSTAALLDAFDDFSIKGIASYTIFLLKWIREKEIDKKSLLTLLKKHAESISATTAEFERFKRCLLNAMETPEFKNLVYAIETFRKFDWIDPVILLEKRSAYSRLLEAL